jgi:phosphoenolpyruvate-protein kinase (PTS system EI component)
VEAVPVLLGLGLRSLSVAPPAIPEVKAVVRRIDLDDARDLADRALTAASAAAVRARSRELLSSLNVSPRPDAADAPGAPPS